MRWVQQFGTESFGDAATTLQHLSQAETRSATRRRTLLSLGKLALAAAPGMELASDDVFKPFTAELDLLALQDQLPASLWPKSIPPGTPLNPVALAHAFAQPVTTEPREPHLVRALDILENLTPPAASINLAHEISLVLSAAIAAEIPKWTALQGEEPLDSIRRAFPW